MSKYFLFLFFSFSFRAFFFSSRAVCRTFSLFFFSLLGCSICFSCFRSWVFFSFFSPLGCRIFFLFFLVFGVEILNFFFLFGTPHYFFLFSELSLFFFFFCWVFCVFSLSPSITWTSRSKLIPMFLAISLIVWLQVRNHAMNGMPWPPAPNNLCNIQQDHEIDQDMNTWNVHRESRNTWNWFSYETFYYLFEF